jgi:hypothetical protein
MLKIYFQSLILLFMTILAVPVFSAGNIPVSIDSVDYKRIEHKKVRKLILRQKHFGVNTFNEMNPVCYSSTDSNIYRTFTKSKLIRQDANVVWTNLTQLSPKDEFDGRIVKFGLLYSKRHNNILYRNEVRTGIEEGQILFFNLRVLSGFKNLAVALEVTHLDNDNKTVEYCYVDHGSTKGTQKIILSTTPEGFTEITQVTRYKCNSRFRNNRLYAFFHERIVNELFKNIQNKSELGVIEVTGI